jgi:hypothetical protein
MFNLTIKGLFVWYPILGLIFQLILGTNSSSQLIMNGNTPLHGSIPVDRPMIMVIVALPLERAVIFSQPAALRRVVSRRQSQPFIPARKMKKGHRQ